MVINRYYILLWPLLQAVFTGCTGGRNNTGLHFTTLPAAQTNIRFNNLITESDSINVFTNEYMYNGSGVGVGDFNNDGLQDVFFCGSMLSSKLYLNKGNIVFDDVTTQAGVTTNRWCTGVSVVDINNDGFQDIYVSASHSPNPQQRKNLLFINNGKLGFTNQAEAYHLADTGCSTQSAFFDYDRDGDLDMYLLNHRLYSHTANNLQPIDSSGNAPAQDRLYRNDGIPADSTHPVFTEVALQAGIKEDGYGLGLIITDANKDGWPDIYVANDYIGNDLLWLNNRNGTFSNVIAAAIRHQSYNSMGVDAADINNDGLTDIVTLDMQPENNERKKMMPGITSQEKFDMQQRFGYQPSYVRNMLQLNNGNHLVNGTAVPFYSEIGQLAGIYQTDWSWSVLMADFDNDGFKDMHITNGLGKDVTNSDYTAFRNAQANTSTYTFGGNNTQNLDKHTIETLRKNMDEYGSITMDNYLYKNNGQLGFTDITQQAGLKIPSISNGAAYADLDNDGDLDLLVNNMNQEAFVCRNELRKAVTDTTHNFISLQLKGPAGNTSGIGATATLYGIQLQYAEQSPVRGFSSSVDQRLLFGLGNALYADSVLIQWPDGKLQLLQHVPANQSIIVQYNNAGTAAVPPPLYSYHIFNKDTATLPFTHTETPYFDFSVHQPLPQRFSQLGPCLASADVNADGLTDFFAGGAAGQQGQLFIQQKNGRFNAAAIHTGNKPGEDLGALFFDADGDKDVDLLVTGGSMEFSVPQYNQPRLYNNDGNGNFTLNSTALPIINGITKAATAADYDGDGDADLFIGGRILAQNYPQAPRSYLLQNNGGQYTDVTTAVCPALQYPGMVTAASFNDFDNDHKPDLVIAGEWMGIQFFKNINGRLAEITNSTGLAGMSGLWRSLQWADIDRDGDADLVAGNIGLNNRYQVSSQQPMMLYVKDMDNNGFADMVPAYHIKNKQGAYHLYPALDRNQLSEQVPAVKKKYLLHANYATITMQQLQQDYGDNNWKEWICQSAATVWIENLGAGKFKTHTLPLEAQFAPVNCIMVQDVDGDKNADLLLAGNEYQADVNTGRYDASYGVLLKGNGKGNFTTVPFAKSGLLLQGDIRDITMLQAAGKRLLLAAPNNGNLQIFSIN